MSYRVRRPFHHITSVLIERLDQKVPEMDDARRNKKIGKPPPSVCESQLVSYLCCFEPFPALLFSGLLDPSRVQEVLNSLVSAKPPFLRIMPNSGLTPHNFQWEVRCFMKRLGFPCEVDVLPLLVQFLTSNRIAYASHICRSLKPDARTPHAAFRECEGIVAFANEQPQMFRQLKPQLVHVIFAAGQDELVLRFGVSSFEVVGAGAVDGCDVSKFLGVSPVAIFSHWVSYGAPKFLDAYQKMVTGKNPFPCALPVDGGDRRATLTNASILTSRHFVDAVVRAAQSSFMMRDIGKGLDALGEVDVLSDYLVIAIVEKRLHDQQFVSYVLNMMRKHTHGNSLATEYVRRMTNDLDVLDRLKLFVGRVFQSEDIESHSMPYLLLNVLTSMNIEPFVELSSRPFSIISDEDRVHDYGFAMGFFAAGYVLSLINANEASAVEAAISKLEKLLVAMSDHEMLDLIITDLFSLLFLKDNTGSFIFQATTVERILSVISIFAKDSLLSSYLLQGLKKLQLSSVISGDNRIESALVPTSLFMYQALLKGDFAISERVGTMSKKLCTLYSVYHGVWQHRSSLVKESFDPDPNAAYDYLIAEEISLSIPGEDKAIEFVLSNTQIGTQDVKSLVLERKERKDSMKIVKKCTSADKAMQKLLDLTARSWKTGEFSSAKPQLFSGFFHYLDGLIPVLLGVIGLSVFDVTSVGHKKIITRLLQHNKFAEAEKIAQIMHTSLVEYVLGDSSIDHAYVYPMMKDKPLTIFLDKVLAGNAEERSKLTGVMAKYYEQQTRQTKTVDDYDLTTQQGCPDDVLLKQFQLGLAEGQDDVIIDLSYRLKNDQIQAAFDEFARTCDAEKLKWLCNLLPACGCSEETRERILVLETIASKGMQSFPLKTCFDKLITENDVVLARRFLESFLYDFDARSVIRRHVLDTLKAHNPEFQVLLNLCPALKVEVVESLPPNYRAILERTEASDRSGPDNSFDPVEWLREHIADKDVVLSFLTTNREVNCDSEFSRMMSEYLSSTESLFSKVAKVYSLIRTFGVVFRCPEKLLYPVSKQLFKFLDEIKVVDASSEQYAETTTCWIRNVIREIKILYDKRRVQSRVATSLSETCMCIMCLADFIHCAFCARGGVCYSFHNFLSKESGETLCEICYRYDEITLATNIAKAWRIRDYPMREGYAILCFSLGHYDEGIRYSPNRRGTTSRLSSEQSVRFSARVIDLFSYPFLYESEVIAALQQGYDVEMFMDEFLGLNSTPRMPRRRITPSQSMVSRSVELRELVERDERAQDEKEKKERRGSRVSFAPDYQVHIKKFVASPSILVVPTTPHFFRRIEAIAKGQMTSCPSPKNTKMLRHFLKTTSKVSDQVGYFVSGGNFEKAFKYLKMQPTEQARWTLFFETIFVKAYAFNNCGRLKYRIKEVDPTLEEFFGRFLEKLLSYSMKQHMPHLQLELELVLERMEIAAVTAIGIATSPETSIRSMINFLKVAYRALEFEQKGKGTVKRLPNKMTPRQIESLKYEIDLQRRFCEFCVKTLKLTYCDLHLFGVQKDMKESMVVCLYKNLEFELATDIQEFYRLSALLIGQKLSDIWVNETEAKIQSFFAGLDRSVSVHVFQQLVSSMLTRFVFVFDCHNLAISLIQHAIRDPDFKCRLLIQFFCLEDAFRIAKKNKLMNHLPLIGHWAQYLNLTPLANDINNMLARK